jgi:hypothetical protein
MDKLKTPTEEEITAAQQTVNLDDGYWEESAVRAVLILAVPRIVAETYKQAALELLIAASHYGEMDAGVAAGIEGCAQRLMQRATEVESSLRPKEG